VAVLRFRPTSLRSRLVALFVVGSSAVVVLTSAFLYLGFNSQLKDAIDQALRDRAADIALDVGEGNLSLRPGEPFAVILATSGQVLEASSPAARRATVLSREDLAEAATKEVVLDRRHIPGLGQRARLLARPGVGPNGAVVLVVGESLDTLARARARLGLLLGATCPVLIGLIGWCGWVLAGAALRPVRRLTEEADAISLQESGQRLPQPPGDDEIAHLGRTLNAMLARIEASVTHERAFLDDASHELRTPISILRGELELAAEEPADVEGVRRALASALQEADRLSRLTDDLLVLARADRGRLDGRQEQLDLAAAAAEAVRRRATGGQPVEVAMAAGAVPVPVRADPVGLVRVLDNLLANAARHAQERVEVRVDVDGGRAHLVVVDDGEGFPPGFLASAFDRFTRADAPRKRDDGGSGLGLAIVAAVVSSHGGTVAAANGPPLGGGRVDVWLPLAESAAEVPAAPSTTPAGAAGDGAEDEERPLGP
jgi:two-component system, OmpR family, sensor kinase